MLTAPQQPTPEQLRAALESSKQRLQIVQKQIAACKGVLATLPPGAIINGLQIVVGEHVTDMPTDPIRYLIEAQIDALELEETVLSAQCEALTRMSSGLLVARRALT